MDILAAALSAKRRKAQAAKQAAHSAAWLAESKRDDINGPIERTALLAFGPVTQAAWAAWGTGTVDPTPIARRF